MAQIEINIRRDNGTTIKASSEVADSYVADIAMTLTALLFDSAAVPAIVPATPTNPPAPVLAATRPTDVAPEPPMPQPGKRTSTV